MRDHEQMQDTDAADSVVVDTAAGFSPVSPDSAKSTWDADSSRVDSAYAVALDPGSGVPAEHSDASGFADDTDAAVIRDLLDAPDPDPDDPDSRLPAWATSDTESAWAACLAGMPPRLVAGGRRD